MREVDEHVKIWKLLQGYSAETSGGLLIMLPASLAPLYCSELYSLDGCEAWIIGDVLAADHSNQETSKNTCTIIENPTILEI